MLVCSKEAANVALNEYWNTIDPKGSTAGQTVMPGGLRVYNRDQIEAMQRGVEAALRLIDDAGEPLTMPAGSVAGHCPACGGEALYLGAGGHVTCARVECPNPSVVDELLQLDPRAEDPCRFPGLGLALIRLHMWVDRQSPEVVPHEVRQLVKQLRARVSTGEPDDRPGHIRGGEGVVKPSRPPSGPSPVGVLDAEALHRREMIEGGPRPLDRLTQQIAGLADTVIRSEGRLADRVADLARLVVELRVADQPLEAALERTEPTEADLWQAALNMAAAQRDRKSLDGARVLREALWFLRQMQDGPPADDEIDDDPEPAAEDAGPPFARPHLFSAVKSSGGLCDVAGCSRPLMDDIHKLPGNGYAGPNPITAPAG